MHPSTLITLLLIPTLALSTPAPHHRSPIHHQVSTTTSSTPPPAATSWPDKPFTVIAARSASPIHLLSLNAAGQSFYLGGEPATYCPLPPSQGTCPPGNVTAFLGLNNLDVLVPGGQTLYVSPSLAIGFTQAHSASIPPGAQVGGFSYVAPVAGGNGLGDFGYSGFGAVGFMACPTADGRWQVFAGGQNATAPMGDVSKCLGFDALTSDYVNPAEGAAAWEYT
jgi:hypothetical protein